jgi:hypothetical protein
MTARVWGQSRPVLNLSLQTGRVDADGTERSVWIMHIVQVVLVVLSPTLSLLKVCQGVGYGKRGNPSAPS